jgi:hypothetical protein
MTKIYSVRAICPFILFLLFSSSALADIVQGQDITYRYLGNDSVELTASIYHDCHAIPATIVQFGIIPSCSTAFYVNVYTAVSKTDITPICKYGCTACSSGSCKGSFGFEKDVFKTVVDLSQYKNCCDFTFSCNTFDQREASATGGYGEFRYSEAHMNRCKTGYHSSPVFDYDPVMIACKNNCVSRLQSVSDFNGDSLVYSIVDPLTAASKAITYNTGYSASHPVDVSATGNCTGYKLDAASGLLSFNATKTNIYSTAIRVDFWHKDSTGSYVKTGDMMRDADLFIQDCSTDTSYPANTLSSTIATSISGINGVSGVVSDSVCAGTTLSFSVGGASGNPIDSVRLLPRDPALARYLTYSLSGIGNKAVRVNFSITPPSKMARQEPYVFDLVLRTQRCPRPDYATKRFYLYVNDSVPDLKIIKTDSGCARYYFSTSAGASSHLNYNWRINGTSVSHDSSFIYQFPRNQMYSIQLTVSSNGSCTRTFADSISLTGLPAVVASRDTTICMYDSVDLSASGATTYRWKSADGKFSSANQSIRVPPGTYYVTGSDTGGCSATDTVVVKAVGSELQWDKDIYACEGDSINIVVKNGEGYYFTWWVPDAQFPLPDSTNWVHTRRIRSPYNFYAFKPYTHCYVHGTVVVHVNHMTGGGDKSVCKGDSVQLHASGGTRYQWKAATGLKDLNIPNPYVHTTADRAYAVQITDSLGCIKQDTVHVKVSDMALIVSKAVTICHGSKVRLSASGGTHYQWSPASGLNDREIATPMASPDVTTMYHVIACDSLCGCVKHDSVLVTVLPVVNADAGPDRLICRGDTITLGSPARKGYHYHWTSSDPRFRKDTAQLTLAPVVNTTYTLLMTDTATGCSDTDMVNVKVHPVTPLKLVLGSVSGCTGVLTVYRVNEEPGYKYHWVAKGIKPYSNLDTSSIMVQLLGPNPVLKLIRTSPDGCKDSLVLPITLFKPAHADFLSIRTCAGMQYIFMDTIAENTSHMWDFGDSWTDASNSGTVTHVYKNPGLYLVKETVFNNGGCTDRISRLIQVLRPATAHWNVIIKDSGAVDFSASDSTGKAYQWDFGDSSTFLGTKTPHHYRNPGNYVISLSITDSANCTARFDSVIFIKPWHRSVSGEDSLIISPNPFSESIHVRYYLKENSSNVKVFIYDMLGKEVYASATNAIAAGSYDQEISTVGHQFGLGMYVIKVLINDRTTIRKMLKVSY